MDIPYGSSNGILAQIHGRFTPQSDTDSVFAPFRGVRGRDALRPAY
jgi:hypothetical protein